MKAMPRDTHVRSSNGTLGITANREKPEHPRKEFYSLVQEVCAGALEDIEGHSFWKQ